jgi:hypothetical protein
LNPIWLPTAINTDDLQKCRGQAQIMGGLHEIPRGSNLNPIWLPTASNTDDLPKVGSHEIRGGLNPIWLPTASNTDDL